MGFEFVSQWVRCRTLLYIDGLGDVVSLQKLVEGEREGWLVNADRRARENYIFKICSKVNSLSNYEDGSDM